MSGDWAVMKCGRGSSGVRGGGLAAAVLFAVVGAAGAQTPAKPVRVSGSWSGWFVQTAVAKQFEHDAPYRAGVHGGQNHDGFRQLAAGHYDVLMYTPLSADGLREDLAKGFGPGTAPPARYDFGQFAVQVIVSEKRPSTRKISLEQLRAVLSGDAKTWADIGQEGGQIHVICEGKDSKAEEIVRARALGGARPRGSVTRRKSAAAVAWDVSRDPAALGICLYPRQDYDGVRILALQAKGADAPVPLDDAAVLERRYPLTQELVLYCRADASPAVRNYCAYATSTCVDDLSKDAFAYGPKTRPALSATFAVQILGAMDGLQ